MKCIHCARDSNYKDRPNGKCPGCGRPFAFEPKGGDPYTDRRFQVAIERVSASGKVRFLPEHVRYDLLRDKPDDTALVFAIGGAIFSTIFAVALFLAQAPILVIPLLLSVVITVISLVARVLSPPRARLPPDRFLALWTRYTAAHGKPAGMIEGPRKVGPPREELRQELTHYSFDRVVVCDRPQIAEILLANEFHFENNCAILTIGGYPRDIFETVRDMLRNNPRIEVFALHDATPEGCMLAHKLRNDPAWFKDVGTVFDVAFRPAQADRFRNLCEEISISLPPSPAYTEEERAWLCRYALFLECLPPEQLIKRLFRAMHQLPEVVAAGGAPDGGLVWVGEAHTSDGGGDAFG